MPVENATTIAGLNASNPAHSDGLNQADAHLRMLKAVLLAAFPGLAGALTTSDGRLGPADGTAAAPSYTFASEPTLGFYRSAAGVMAYAGSLIGGKEIGEIFDYAGTTAPAGSMPCDGTALPRATYPTLFQRIGTTWGAGDGSTTFNIPNLQSRFRRHRDGGALAGAVGNTQAPANLTHAHAVSGSTGVESNDHSHLVQGYSGTMNQNTTHSHGMGFPARVYGNFQTYTSGQAIGGIQYNNGSDGQIVTNAVNTDHAHYVSLQSGGISVNHYHAFSVTSAAMGDPNESRPYSATVLTCIRVQ
ncbi:phage tail protein [Bradyrhizobium sp. USDA 4350]